MPKRATVPRTPKRSRDDEIGQLLVAAGKLLVETGTAVEQLTLAAAAELASRQTNTTISAGRLYSRFRDQDDFRLAVLKAFLEDGPPYSDLALNGLVRSIQQVGDGKSEVLDPNDVPALVAKVAAEH